MPPGNETSEQVFPHHGEALASPRDQAYQRRVLRGVHDDVYAETLRAGDPLFRAEVLQLHVDNACLSVRRICRAAPDPARLDDRLAVEELRRHDRDRHVAELRVEACHRTFVECEAKVGEARERSTVNPWSLRVALLLLGLFAPVAMTWVMYTTFVGTMASNGEALAAVAGASRILGDLSPIDQAIATCLAVTGFVSLVVTTVALALTPLGVFAKAAIFVLEGSLAVSLYFMRASAGPDVEAASVAFASMELALTVFHGVLVVFVGARLREAVAAHLAVQHAEHDRDSAEDEETHWRDEQATHEDRFRRQSAWYSDLVNQLLDQRELEAHAQVVAHRAYRLALQRLAAELLGESGFREATPTTAERPNGHAAKALGPRGVDEITVNGL